MQTLKRRIAELLVGEIDNSTKRGFWLISTLMRKHKYFLLLLLLFGVVIGLVEGAAIGMIAYSAVVVTGSDTTCPAAISKILSYTPLKVCENYDKYKIFLYLVYGSILVQVLKSLVVYASGFLGVILKTRIVYEVKKLVIAKMVTLDFYDSLKIPTGEKQLIIGNSLNISNFVIVINQIIVTLFVLMTYVAILVAMDWKLSLLSGVLIFFLLFIVSPLIKKIRQISFQVRKNSKYMHRKLIDYMFSIRLIKLFGKDKEIIDELDMVVRKEVGFLRSSAAYNLALDPLQETIVILSVGAMLLYSFFSAGESIEEFLPTTLAFVLVLHKCNTRVATINTIRASYAKAMAGIQYVTDFLDLESSVIHDGEEILPADWNEIRFDDVSFSYNNSISIINSVNFEIKRGETVAFVGGSGAGKSTLLDVLVGLLKPIEGKVKIGGISSNEAKKESWISQFSMVSQKELILDNTIKANLRFSNSDASDQDIRTACEVAQIHDFIMSLDKQYDSMMGETGSNVSGGQIQRIAIARAILKDSPILIFDEATSALDSITEKNMINALQAFSQKKTIIMIAHRLSTVVHADRIFVLDKGEIVDFGTHEELLKRQGVYRDLWMVNQ